MIKKIAAFLILFSAAMLLFAGCSTNENSAITGKWEATSASINGETVQFSVLETEGKDFCFEFKSDGTCIATLAGISNNGTYVFNKTSVDIEYGGKTEKLLYDDGVLTLNFYYNNETTSFMFTRTSQ